MDARFTVTDAELAMLIVTPTPRKAFLVNCNADRAAKRHIYDSICDSQDFLGMRIFAENAATPKEKLSFARDASTLVVGIDLRYTAQVGHLQRCFG